MPIVYALHESEGNRNAGVPVPYNLLYSVLIGNVAYVVLEVYGELSCLSCGTGYIEIPLDMVCIMLW